MATKRYDEALKAYRQSRDAFKRKPPPKRWASVATDRRLQDQIEALKDNERNLQREPQASTAAASTRRSIGSATRFNSSKAADAVAPARPPPVPAGLSMAIGSAYFRLDEPPDAEREYKAAIDVNPTFGEAHSNLAVVYFVTGRCAQAEDGESRRPRRPDFG